MANYSSIRATINANVKANNNQEITGNILNSVLNEMIDSLGAGYLFKGIASTSTNPGSPDEKVFYIAGTIGTYTYFNNLSASENELTIFYFDTAWHKTSAQITTEHPVDVENDADADLDIGDEDINILVRFNDGHIKVKQFDSRNIGTPPVFDSSEAYSINQVVSKDGLFYIFKANHAAGAWNGQEVESIDLLSMIPGLVKDAVDTDLDLVDQAENVLVRFSNGHIMTKNFDSSTLGRTHWYGKEWMGFGTSITNTSSEGKYPTYLAQISGLAFINHGHSGGGITTASDQAVYNDVMTADLSTADLITLEVGANDGSAPLGTPYDGLPGSGVQDNSTLCGALNLCIRHLQAESNAQVVVMCSPPSRYQRTNPSNQYSGNEQSGTDNHTKLELNEAIERVCKLNSCWFIPAGMMDGMGYARLNASNDYNVDQIHQSDLGGYNFAQAIWAFLKNIPLFYTN